MTLNIDLKRRNSLHFAFFTEFDNFAGQLCHSDWRQTYNVRRILYPRSSLPLLAKTNPSCSMQSLHDSWATCITWWWL